MLATRRSAEISKLVWVIVINVVAAIGVLFVLWRTLLVVGWILVALFLALALNPLVQQLERLGLRRTWAVLAVFATGVGLVATLAATLIPPLLEQARGFVAAAPELLDRLRHNRPFQWADERFQLIERARQELMSHAGAAALPVFRVLGSVLLGLAAVITIVSLTAFMLLFGEQVYRSLLQWVEPSHRPRWEMLVQRMHRAVGGFVSGTLFVALIGGTVVAVTLAVLRVPYFLPLGLTMTLLGVVPYVGSSLGGLLVVGTTLLTTGLRPALIALGVFLLYQQFENHLLHPLVQRHTIKMNALLIALVMLLGTALAGVFGALLALPVAAAIQVVLQDVLERRQARWQPASPPTLPAATSSTNPPT